MRFPQALDQYKKNEILAHVELDDVIIKVTQELGEMLEAKMDNNLQELAKETADTVVNILSASKGVDIIPDIENISNKENISSEQLFIQMKNRTQAIQGLRKRYSRDNISKQEFKNITEIFLSHVLSYGGVQKTLEEILDTNSVKFANRIDDYKPNLDLKNYINEYQDFPRAPVSFKDISPLLTSPEAMRYLSFELAQKCDGVDVIVGLDARGFLFGPLVAEILHIPFIMIRKKGKLPGETINQEYKKEYGSDIMEIQKGSILPGQKAVLIDDLLATGGTMDTAGKLIEQLGGKVHKVLSVVQINDEFCSQMREKYNLTRYDVESIIHYEK
ncbi:MAG: adenine phosphoribosyltransferase [Candidatus Absconditicoccaceae bacterium]